MNKIKKSTIFDYIRRIFIAAVMTSAGMFCFELFKETHFYTFTKWQSHIMTITVTTFLSILITFFILKRRDYYINIVIDENKEINKANDNIKTLLQEKVILLNEVHHRIKNNMSIVYSLLKLQAGKTNNAPVIEILNDAAGRIQSMMILYEKLYTTTDVNNLNIKDYLSKLIDEIISIFPNKDNLKVEKKIESFIIPAKKISIIGIIINELITNSMKYAFTYRKDGSITISASIKSNLITITVQDNGIGIPESIDINNTESFGLSLIRMETKQLNGNIRIDNENGCKTILEFEI